jgi:hypothetical protein
MVLQKNAFMQQLFIVHFAYRQSSVIRLQTNHEKCHLTFLNLLCNLLLTGICTV